METLEQQFNSRVRVFLGRTGVSPTTFGMKALGDPNLMRQIDGGRSLSLRTADRVLAFVADYDLDSGGPRTPPRGHRRPEAFVTGEENEEEQSDDRRATYGRTGVRKRRGGPMRTLALRRCARVLRSKPRHGHVLRLRGRVGQRRTGSTDRDGSDPPVRGPGTGSEAGVFAHPCPRPPGVAPEPSIPTREGGLSAASRRRITSSPTDRPSGSRASPSKAGVPPMAGAAAQAAKSGTRPSQVTVVQPQSSQRHTEPLARTSQRWFRAHAPRCRCARAVCHGPPVIGGQDRPPEPLSTRLENNLPMIAPDS